jgi:hypothetical protein
MTDTALASLQNLGQPKALESKKMETPAPIRPDDAWKIACHEAGHAVVAVRLGVPFNYAENGGGTNDIVDVGVAPLEASRPRPEVELSNWQKFYAGGAAAELLLFGKLREEHEFLAYSRDRHLHGEYERLRGINRTDGWDQDVKSAMSILDGESILKVATELNMRKKISEEEVYAIFDLKPSWW